MTATGAISESLSHSSPTDMNIISYSNVFSTEQEAKKASALMRRSNAIIRACLLVDPDFVPDWKNGNQTWMPIYQHARQKWDTSQNQEWEISPAYVSSPAKCKQVCALLTKWGVK